LRHRRSLAFEVLALVALGGTLACGDDEPARDQSVFWMTLGTSGATCSSARTYSVPDETARTVTSGNGQGERLVDGDDGLVECRVQEAAAGQFNVSLNLTSGEIGALSIRGTASKAPNVDGTATIDIDFRTTGFRLQQDGCTATVREALAGAVWLDDLSCPGLIDPSSPSISCTGTGGLIIENCSR
jgi:hypothetical protein